MKIVTRNVKETAKKLSTDYETPEEIEEKHRKLAEESEKRSKEIMKNPDPTAKAKSDIFDAALKIYSDTNKEYRDKPADASYTERKKLAKKTMETVYGKKFFKYGHTNIKDWNSESLDERYDSLMNSYKSIKQIDKDAEEFAEKLKKIKRSENKDEYDRLYTDLMDEIKLKDSYKKEIRTLLKTDGMAEKIKEESAKSKAKPSKEKITKALNEAIIRLEDGNGEDAKVALLEGIFGGDDWGAFHPDSNPPPFSTRNKIDFILIEENLKGDEAKKRRLELKRMSPEEIDKIYNSKKKK